jgi:hypothetical protein
MLIQEDLLLASHKELSVTKTELVSKLETSENELATLRRDPSLAEY